MRRDRTTDRPEPMTRRRFGAVTCGTFASFALGTACYGIAGSYATDGRIKARPRAGVTTSGAGTRTLGLDPRDATLQLPPRAAEGPLPLMVLLHGAGGRGAGILRRLGAAAEAAGVAVLAPDSRESTWDGVRGGFGPDPSFIDVALERVFDIVAVDPRRISIGGFSDGASYALSLGLINGDLFSRVVAFSPGFVVPGRAHGKPRLLVSHGTSDTILPVDRCSRVIVPALQKQGYEVTYREFAGGHEIPADIAGEGLRWAAGRI